MTGNVYKYIPSYGVGTLEMFNRVMLEFYRHLHLNSTGCICLQKPKITAVEVISNV